MEGGDGTGTREALRRFLHTTIAPVAQEIQVEAQAKLDAPVELTFEALAATDLAGKARAFGSLVMAGMKPEEASGITSFVADPDAFREPADGAISPRPT